VTGSSVEGIEDFFDIVAVEFDDVPTKGAILFGKRIDVHNVFDPAVDLEAVFVEDGAEIVELVVTGSHGGFPDGTFLLFAIAHDADDAVRSGAEAGGKGIADSNAEALAEGAGGDFDTGDFETIGVAFKAGAELTEESGVVQREIAGFGEGNVECRGFVACGPEDAVAVGPGRIRRIVIEDAEIETSRQIHDGKRASRMARTGGENVSECNGAHLGSGITKLVR
jgi:hypothetical protein